MSTNLITPIFDNINIHAVANAADINFDYIDGPGGLFIRSVLTNIAEHITYAENPADALHYFVNADAAEVAADFDLSDLAHDVADAEASRIVYNVDVAETWVALNRGRRGQQRR
jgi:hypothetical protein